MKVIEYTATAGGRDRTVRPPYPQSKAVAYTDGGVQIQGDWRVRPFLDATLWDALYVRVCPHIYFPKADWTVYHDTSVVLRKGGEGDPQKLVNDCEAAGAVIGARMVDERRAGTLDDQIDRGVALCQDNYGLDADKYDSEGQRDYYKRYPRVSLNRQPVRGGLVVRKNCEETARLNEKWWEEIVKWGDAANQASLTASLQICGLYDRMYVVPRDAGVGKGHK